MKTLKFYFNFPHSKSPNRPIAQSSNRPIIQSPNLPIIVILLLLSSLFAQREADNWIFNGGAGLNFTTGNPVPLFVNSSIAFHGTVMSDTLGNILFYFDGNTVWNRNDGVMLNGTGILPESNPAFNQSAIAFPKPNSNKQYYIFSVSSFVVPDGLYYSIVDMTLDGGLGGVTAVKNIKLTAANKAAEQLFVLENAKGDGYWVITRLFNDDRYTCFRVDATGVNPVPVYSSTGIYREFCQGGPVKVSPDKKHLVACYWANFPGPLSDFDVCSFDAETGKIDLTFYIARQWLGNSYSTPTGCEFSPDSKYLYVAYVNIDTWSGSALFQYGMQFGEDSSAFHDSGIKIRDNSPWSLQLSNDGRIYTGCLHDTCAPPWDKFVSVISKPWELGAACDFDTLAIYCGGKEHAWDCPNFLLDYLYRFEWEGDDYCQGSAVHFIPHFVPTPDSVEWFFDEFAPGNYSHELSPTYTFQNAGIHEVEVDIWYPTGRFEHTSREIEIFPTPKPDLGLDILICVGTSDTLYANCDADFYSWNGIPGISQYIISDSGFYRVTASFLQTGCSGSDTIHVGFYPATLIDETNLVITPTTCNGASGSITGLNALGPTPYAFIWKDISGNEYGTNIDATDLPAGQYQLTITDGNGCEMASSTYTIEDAGNVQVLEVQLTHPHCFRPDGQIIITAFSPIGSSLQYSIDDGATYQADSVFSGLIAASYVIQVKDENGCEGFYLDNPVVLEDIPGPKVTQVNITNETDFLGNGAVEIIANGSTPVIYYSIDGGLIYQLNNGTFENLIGGIYYVVIKDENGCDTAFTVEIQNIILTYLQAITGSGEQCLGDAVTIPIEVENFKSVAAFRLQLSYNANNLQCEGYTNADPQLQQNLTAWVDQAAGEITFQWQDTVTLTFIQPDTVAELVFTTRQPGLGDIGWYTGETESYFRNISGSAIPAEFHTGGVEVYDTPDILLANSKSLCEGQFLSLMSIASGGHPPISFQWTFPDGHMSGDDPFFFSITQADVGDYTLLATDFMHCTDQKTIHIEVSENPVAAFHGMDTLEMHIGDVLDAGAGMESYEWSTGDTTQSIVIQSEGVFSVGMESLLGCLGRDSIYVKLTSDEIPSNHIFIPNAFSPDNDGLNDIFIAYATSDYIQKFHMLIFDRWGGQIFESNDIMFGWDGTKHGTPLPGGMYTYKITYSIYPSFGDYTDQVRLGTVMLVR